MQIGVEVSRAVENKRIFVVVDDEIGRAALQFMLHDENETHEIASLDQAFAKGAEWRPDLVILGLDIVAQSGTQAVSALGERFPGVKIMILADNAASPAAATCQALGAHDVLVKPLTLENVRHKVDVLLGRKQLPMVSLGMLRSIARA